MTGTANKPDLTHGALAAVIGPVSLLGVASVSPRSPSS